MATQQRGAIVPGAESPIHDEPHVESSRITVRYLARQVDDRGLHPATVAENHDLPVGDVYAALAYFHAHPDEMTRVERQREAAIERAESMTTMTPPADN
jgi:uncharacterized protein (DUF433 family)